MTKNNQNHCPWCHAVIPGQHIEGCPSSALQKMPKKEYENLTIQEQEMGYRLKSPGDKYYTPTAINRTDNLGKLYSRRGMISLLSYLFTYFHPNSENWKILEYLVDDEIKLIDQTVLTLWKPWQKIARRRQFK